MPSCLETKGSHTKTFWVYFALRTIFQWTMNAAFSLSDGTALALAAKHDSDYSYIMIGMQLAMFISPFVAGAVIQDADDGGSNGQLVHALCP